MTASLNVAHTSDGVSTQLNLPTALGLVRPRRERTDSDRQWYNGQLKVQHSKHWDKVVYEKVSYYGSLNPERLAFPSVARLAREVICSARTVQRALRRLEAGGLIKCVSRAGGHATSQYLVVGLRVTPGQAASHPRGDCEAPNDKREGKRDQRTKDPSLSVSIGAQTIDPGAVEESLTTDTVKFIDPALVEEVEKQIGVDCLPFPSQEPSADGKYQHPKQVGMLCAVARKLGREVSEYEQRAFDKLSHERKILTLKPLLEAEQSLAAEGVVTPPPKAAPSPRHEIAHHHDGKSTSQPVCSEHQWTPAAADGVQNCYSCPEERIAP